MKRWTVAGSTLTALLIAIAVPSTVLGAGPFSWGWEYSNSFPNDSDNWYHVRAHTWELNGDHDAAKLRMKVQVWSNSQGLLSQKVITGDLCQAYL